MHMVWDHDGPVTVRELLDELRQERDIAYTTVMSTMDNLHRKGWLAPAKDGKAYRYTATASRGEYSARLMREALAGGRAAEVWPRRGRLPLGRGRRVRRGGVPERHLGVRLRRYPNVCGVGGARAGPALRASRTGGSGEGAGAR